MLNSPGSQVYKNGEMEKKNVFFVFTKSRPFIQCYCSCLGLILLLSIPPQLLIFTEKIISVLKQLFNDKIDIRVRHS